MESQSQLQVAVARSGGFAGMTRQYSVDADGLSPEEAQELRRMLDQIDFFEFEEAATGGSPDAFQYTVTVQEGGRKRTVRAGEDSALSPLIDFVRDHQAGASPPGNYR